MSKELYYTPSLDEFFVGFEYEYKSAPNLSDENDGFIKTSFPIFRDIKGIEFALINYPGIFRVKYLDNQDIEECGFTYDNNLEPIPSRQEFEHLPIEEYELPLAFTKDTQLKDRKLWILYLYKDNTIWIEHINNCANYEYYFKGIIRNKSELKKLLKQLGINE